MNLMIWTLFAWLCVLMKYTEGGTACRRMEVSGCSLPVINGQYDETSITCNERSTFQLEEKNYFLQYTSNGFWVVSSSSCTIQGYAKAVVRAHHSAPSPERVDIEWQEKGLNGWINSSSLRLSCQDRGLYLSPVIIIAIVAASIPGCVLFVFAMIKIMRHHDPHFLDRVFSVECKCSGCGRLCRALPCTCCHNSASTYEASVSNGNSSTTFVDNGVTYVTENVAPSASGRIDNTLSREVSPHCIENPAYIKEIATIDENSTEGVETTGNDISVRTCGGMLVSPSTPNSVTFQLGNGETVRTTSENIDLGES